MSSQEEEKENFPYHCGLKRRLAEEKPSRLAISSTVAAKKFFPKNDNNVNISLSQSEEEKSETYVLTNNDDKKCNCGQKAIQAVNLLRDEMKHMFTELSCTIIQLRKEIRATKTSGRNFDCDHTLPFPTLESLLEFEARLQNQPGKLEELQQAFMQRGPSEPSKFIKASLRMIFKDETAKEFCWIGNKNKKSAKILKLMVALKNAFHTKFPGTPEEVFDKIAMRFFQYAKDRLCKKEKYNKRASTAETSN